AHAPVATSAANVVAEPSNPFVASSAACPASSQRVGSTPGSLVPAYTAARALMSPFGHGPRQAPPFISLAERCAIPTPPSQSEERSHGGSRRDSESPSARRSTLPVNPRPPPNHSSVRGESVTSKRSD